MSIGSSGVTQVKSFDDGDAASKHIAKVFHEKVKKGYVEQVDANQRASAALEAPPAKKANRAPSRRSKIDEEVEQKHEQEVEDEGEDEDEEEGEKEGDSGHGSELTAPDPDPVALRLLQSSKKKGKSKALDVCVALDPVSREALAVELVMPAASAAAAVKFYHIQLLSVEDREVFHLFSRQEMR